MNTDKISLIGLGKLGLPLLSTFANNGQKILGIDVDVRKVEDLKCGQIPFHEPALDSYFKNAYDNIELSTDFKKVVEETDIAIILVNTPSRGDGSFSNEYVYNAAASVCRNLKKSNKKDFLFIISSTVMPESCKDIIRFIESESGRKLNNGFGYVHIPDLVALGSVIKDFEHPDFVILGESDKRYGDIALSIYNKIIKNSAPVARMTPLEAEVTKVSLNAYITMKISFANFLGNVCEILGCESSRVTKALGHDKRISPYYIKSGLAFGGTCFPRDTWAFINLSDRLGLDAVHIKATDKINKDQNEILYNKVKKHTDKSIGIVGLSFKPDTFVTTESPGEILYRRLISEHYLVDAFDPLDQNRSRLNIKNFISWANVVVLTHNDKRLIENVDFSDKIVIDPWGLLN